MDQHTAQELLSTGRHQECLQACQQLLQSEPENPLPWKYAGKSLLALGELEKAQQCLAKAHQLDTTDPETVKDIGNIFLNLGRTGDATKWYKKSLKININYAPAQHPKHADFFEHYGQHTVPHQRSAGDCAEQYATIVFHNICVVQVFWNTM